MGLDKCPGTALELGSGNGNNLMLFREYGWNVVGVDVDPGTALADAEANFSLAEATPETFTFLRHDLTSGLPNGLPAQVNALLIPSVLYYVPRASAIRVLTEARRFCSRTVPFFLRMRGLRDYRRGRGEEVGPNGTRLTIEETGERNAINVFYHEYELVDLVRERLGAEPASIKVLHVDHDNLQNDKIITNSDVVIWGRLGG